MIYNYIGVEEYKLIKKLRKFKELMTPKTWNPFKFINQDVEFNEIINKTIKFLSRNKGDK